jgi:hypothetical protein
MSVDGYSNANKSQVSECKILRWAVTLWFSVAVIGQWIFVSYLLLAYGGSALTGNVAAWNKKLSHGYVVGDTLGNLAVAAHLLFAVIILVAGPLQLIPWLRVKFPRFHRCNGRVYLASVLLASMAGLYMLLVQGTVGDWTMVLGLSIDALLIITFGLLALRYALKRDFVTHRRWALRLFMVVSAVWFFRVGLMLWLVIFQAPVGFDPDTFIGPFASFMAFAQYLIPLALLELYLWVHTGGSAKARLATAIVIFLVTLAMALGIFGAIMGLWFPA